MGLLNDLLLQGRDAPGHRPWPRAIVDAAVWRAAIAGLAEHRLTLLGFWGEPESVHLALLEEISGEIAVVSLPCAEGHFPSVAARHAPAQRLRRGARRDAAPGRPRP